MPSYLAFLLLAGVVLLHVWMDSGSLPKIQPEPTREVVWRTEVDVEKYPGFKAPDFPKLPKPWLLKPKPRPKFL